MPFISQAVYREENLLQRVYIGSMANLFYFLFFTVPLILYPYTSELFEFNKMILVYILTVLIVAAWLSRCLAAKKFIFRRTILDIPLLIFLGTQLLSTIFSVDIRTSFLGYYSRFNGGFLSVLSYSLLYWAYVSNMDRKSALKTMYLVLCSAVIVSIYGILEHFGIDKNIWVQDVQNRVFSTLGQPNWLAAYIVALMPLAWSYSISNFQFPSAQQIINFKSVIRKSIPYFLSILLFITLLFTKSRSGILGFILIDLIFWPFYFLKQKRQAIIPLIIHNSLILILILIIGTPWTPGLRQVKMDNQPLTTGPALETGGTESGEIRKIVWKGAIEIWKHYPILGTGVETFAYSYYNFRPVEHNLVSEWDFLYNKAHNEYLNFLATTGTLGFLAYIALIGFSIYQIFKNFQFPIFNFQSNPNLKIKRNKNSLEIVNCELVIALAAGYVSILVTNFFGFSVVPISLLFFLFPAFVITLGNDQQPTPNIQLGKINTSQKILSLIVVGCLLEVIFCIAKYWYADILYNKGESLNDQQKYVEARKFIIQAIGLSPHEAIFYDELSQSSAGIALALSQTNEKAKANDFITEAISESQRAIGLSPANVNLKRSQASLFFKLTLIDPNYLLNARDIILLTIEQAPTDAKLFYNLGLTYARIGDVQSALQTLEKTIELKPNYKEARFAYALILIDKKEFQRAKEQLQYILEKIDPNDTLAKQQLEELK